MALGPRIITPFAATNKNRPAVSMPSILTSLPGCLAAWECNSRADATGNLANLPAPLLFGDNGIQTTGGAYSIATGLKPASPYMTIGLAARAASDSATGYLLGNVSDTSGCGIRFNVAGGGIDAVQRLAGGHFPQTDIAEQSLGTWFAVVVSFSTIGINGIDNLGHNFLVNYGSQSLNAPALPFFLGSREGSTNGLKCTLGAIVICNGVLDADRKAETIVKLRAVMAEKGVAVA